MPGSPILSLIFSSLLFNNPNSTPGISLSLFPIYRGERKEEGGWKRFIRYICRDTNLSLQLWVLPFLFLSLPSCSVCCSKSVRPRRLCKCLRLLPVSIPGPSGTPALLPVSQLSPVKAPVKATGIYQPQGTKDGRSAEEEKRQGGEEERQEDRGYPPLPLS